MQLWPSHCVADWMLKHETWFTANLRIYVLTFGRNSGVVAMLRNVQALILFIPCIPSTFSSDKVEITSHLCAVSVTVLVVHININMLEVWPHGEKKAAYSFTNKTDGSNILLTLRQITESLWRPPRSVENVKFSLLNIPNVIILWGSHKGAVCTQNKKRMRLLSAPMLLVHTTSVFSCEDLLLSIHTTYNDI